MKKCLSYKWTNQLILIHNSGRYIAKSSYEPMGRRNMFCDTGGNVPKRFFVKHKEKACLATPGETFKHEEENKYLIHMHTHTNSNTIRIHMHTTGLS